MHFFERSIKKIKFKHGGIHEDIFTVRNIQTGTIMRELLNQCQ